MNLDRETYERRVAADAAIDRRQEEMRSWSGEGSPPRFCHWTSRGVIAIEAWTHRYFRVTLGNREVGPAPDDVRKTFSLIVGGSYDKELGFSGGELNLPALAEWNGLS